MNESQLTLGGIIFLVTALCACGSGPQSFEALAAQAADSTSGTGKGVEKRKKDAKDDDEEVCDLSDYRKGSLVAICEVNTESPVRDRQVCTDANTAKSKYGLDPKRPNSVGLNGLDHLGAC